MYLLSELRHLLHRFRMEGPSEFTDSEGRVWIGTFNGKKANGLTLKLL